MSWREIDADELSDDESLGFAIMDGVIIMPSHAGTVDVRGMQLRSKLGKPRRCDALA
jgi:hypothetical protein